MPGGIWAPGGIFIPAGIWAGAGGWPPAAACSIGLGGAAGSVQVTSGAGFIPPHLGAPASFN
ncbi:MAG: hypothetical protein ACREOE_19875, partial [Gemmatimonadales bacterium]